MTSLVDIKTSSAAQIQNISSQSATKTSSAVELFSYVLCCTVQGLFWAAGLALIVLAPLANS